MIKVLYYNEEEIINSLAESLVIGGLPMNDKVPTSESLKKEIDELKNKLTTIWKYKELFNFDKVNKVIRLKENTGVNMVDGYYESLDVYTKRARTLGNEIGRAHV